MGNSPVPTHWYPYTLETGNYLDITNKITSTSVKEHLREKFLKYWAVTFQVLPTVAGDQDTLTPPEDDSEVAPVPPTDDSQTAPVPPTDDSQDAPVPSTGDYVAPQMPATIGF